MSGTRTTFMAKMPQKVFDYSEKCTRDVHETTRRDYRSLNGVPLLLDVCLLHPSATTGKWSKSRWIMISWGANGAQNIETIFPEVFLRQDDSQKLAQ